MDEAVTVRVFDPAMCCSTGVCGPDVDPELVRFAADVAWLEGEGVRVERYNLAQQPGAFASDPQVRRVLQESGEGALPLVIVGGAVKSSGAYPSRELLAAWAGAPVDPTRTARRSTPLPLGEGGSTACCTPAGDVGSRAPSGGSCC